MTGTQTIDKFLTLMRKEWFALIADRKRLEWLVNHSEWAFHVTDSGSWMGVKYPKEEQRVEMWSFREAIDAVMKGAKNDKPIHKS